MKLNKLSFLVGMAMSAGLVGCATTTAPTTTQATEQTKSGSFNYPHTRTHAEKRDHLLVGEYGRPDDFVGAGSGSAPLRPDDGVDNYITETVVDKYRWLENIDPINPEYRFETESARERNVFGSKLEDDVPDNQLDNRTRDALKKVNPDAPSSEVNDWVNAQTALTNEFLHALPIYDQVRANITSFMGSKHIRQTEKKDIGTIEYYRAEDGQDRITFTDLDGNIKTIFDERESMKKGEGLNYRGEIYPSKTGKYFVQYLFTGNGDNDPINLHVYDTETGRVVYTRRHIGRPENISDVSWDGDEAFYYICQAPYGWSTASVCRHEMGSERFNDPVEASQLDVDQSWIDGFWFESVDKDAEDKRYLVMEGYAWRPTFHIKDRVRNRVYRIHNQKFQDRIKRDRENMSADILAKYVHFDPKTEDVWFISTENDPKGQLLKTNLQSLHKREVVVSSLPQYDFLVEGASNSDSPYVLLKFLKDGVERIVIFNKNTGALVKDITPEGAGHADNLAIHIPTKKDLEGDNELKKEPYFTFRYRDTITPRTVYTYSLEKDELIDVRRRDLFTFNAEEYETKQITYPSKDGVMVPMTISYKKGTPLDGTAPTMLYGYGGFGVTSDSSFRISRATWIEHGGIWATAFVRGGGEFGSAWASGGKLEQKMNTFYDFEAAADYLAASKYTSYDKIAIIGTSNGGLLVGAATVLNPQKYRVSLPDVGVLDMLRHDRNYHTQYWSTEYGNADDSVAMYNLLKGYSPYHNLKEGVCYPSSLIYTSKRDDRVAPSHSYKYAARLQEVQACDRPVLLYAAEKHGHHPFTHSDRIDQYAMLTAFTLHEMGVTNVPNLTERQPPEAYKTDRQREEEAKAEAKRQETILERQKQK